MDLHPLDDGCIKVCLTECGLTACTVVSSMHLVEDKRKQLQAAILREAAASYTDPMVS
jgi:hypothetical protein